MPLGTEIGPGPSDFVLDGDHARHGKGHISNLSLRFSMLADTARVTNVRIIIIIIIIMQFPLFLLPVWA